MAVHPVSKGTLSAARFAVGPRMIELLFPIVGTESALRDRLQKVGEAGQARKVEKSDPTQWAQVIQVNLVGAFNTVHAAIPHLRTRGAGKIILMGSAIRNGWAPGLSAYAASKAGLWKLTQVLGMELAADHISVNELIPGPVKTAMTQFGEIAMPPGEWIKEPEEVLPLALFLATQPEPGPTAQSFSLNRRAS